MFSRVATVRGSPKRAYSISSRSLTPVVVGRDHGGGEAQVAGFSRLEKSKGSKDAQGCW